MNDHQIVTLISDWGEYDYYVAMCKGKIWSLVPSINIVDISHHIKPFDIAQAAFIFRKSYACFPKGTIHIIGVAVRASYDYSHLIIKHQGHYFIGSNNGFFSLVFDEQPDEIWEIDTRGQDGSLLFPSSEIYAPVSAAIAKGLDISKMAHRVSDYEVRRLPQASVRNNTIHGKVVYIDHYENAYTNITMEQFHQVATDEQSLRISLSGNIYNVNGIASSFDQIATGMLGLLFPFDEHLTIVINEGNAAGLLGLHVGDEVHLMI